MRCCDELYVVERIDLPVLPPPAGLPSVLAPFLVDGVVRQPVERRRNLLTGEWTHLNLARVNRPIVSAVPDRSTTGPDAACVFCPGNEARTPRETTGGDALHWGDPWQLRAFPNLYPWLEEHRNVVETAIHRTGLADVDPDEEKRALQALATLGRQVQARGLFPVVFRNHGGSTSQPHPHWQFGALPRRPVRDALQHTAAAAFHTRHRTNLFDALCAEERRRAERYVAQHGSWHVFCPFAPRFEHEVWIVSGLPCADLASCASDELGVLGETLCVVLRGLTAQCGVQDVLIVVHQLPGESTCYRLFVTVCPGTIWAGAERGFAEFVVEHPPEQTARCLRDALALPT